MIRNTKQQAECDPWRNYIGKGRRGDELEGRLQSECLLLCGDSEADRHPIHAWCAVTPQRVFLQGLVFGGPFNNLPALWFIQASPSKPSVLARRRDEMHTVGKQAGRWLECLLGRDCTRQRDFSWQANSRAACWGEKTFCTPQGDASAGRQPWNLFRREEDCHLTYAAEGVLVTWYGY